MRRSRRKRSAVRAIDTDILVLFLFLVADALHLAAAADCTAFLSFDGKLAKTTAGRSSVVVETP
jgi:hypothetical protein